MNDQDRRMEEVERHERWFAEICPDEERISTEPIKLRVRVAVGEAWLARQVQDEPVEGLSAAVRDRIHAVLGDGGRPNGELRRARRIRSIRWQYLLGPGAVVGVAAALALFFVSLERASIVGPESDAELAALEEFDAGVADEFDASLDALAADLSGLDQLLVERREGWDSFEELYRNFWDESTMEDADDASPTSPS